MTQINGSKNNNKSIGIIGEKAACDMLLDHGYIIKEMNFRVGRIGEIDVIAIDGEYICFIEVKTRTNSIYGKPSESITPLKQKKIRTLASIYLQKFRLDRHAVRFDVIFITASKAAGEYKLKDIELIKNAF